MLEDQRGESRTLRPNEAPIVFAVVVYWAMGLAGMRRSVGDRLLNGSLGRCIRRLFAEEVMPAFG